MADQNRSIYLNTITVGEKLASYAPGGLHPVHLGDILDNRYIIFRKLGSGSQSTVWLARDKNAPAKRFVAVKVLTARSTQGVLKVDDALQTLTDHQTGKRHLDLPLNSFTVHGPNGEHVCEVHEPLGSTLWEVLDTAFNERIEDGDDRASSNDLWSVVIAKRACWQTLQAVDYMHQRRVAHRDIRPRNICFALMGDINNFDENQIQKDVWPKGKEEESAGEAGSQDAESSEDDDDESSEQESIEDESSDEDDGTAPSQPQSDFDIYKSRTKEQWYSCEQGDPNAKPHSEEWNKGNYYQSQRHIALVIRRDGKPTGPDEVRYTVRNVPLAMGEMRTMDLHEERFRLVLTDMGLAHPFEECRQYEGPFLTDYMAPEDILRKPATHKSDIFALGLCCWEIVMLRGLVEQYTELSDPEYIVTRHRMLHMIAKRIGPVPASIRDQWTDADKWVDTDGFPVDRQEEEEDEYRKDPFPRGDIWFQAKRRKPNNMSDRDMELFVRFLLRMLKWQPELRESTSELLKDEWFHDLEGA